MPPALLVALGVVALLAVLVGIAWWIRYSAPVRRTGPESAPPIVFIPADGMSRAAAAVDAAATREHEAAYERVRSGPARYAGVRHEAVATVAEEHDGHGSRHGNSAGAAWRHWEQDVAVRGTSPEPAPPPSVLTGTLRMLPGRLEVLGGLPTTTEIRFVQTGGGPQQRVTIGRQEGAPYEHVQLASQTVSRLHAAMTYASGRWSIVNLSETNPLRVNGAALPREAAALPLADGDVLELGEVVLRFRI